MSCRPSASARETIRRRALAIACVAAIVAAVPAHAGFGDLLKKAKEKATAATGQKTEPENSAATAKPVFDAVTVELTPDRVEHIVASFKAASAASAGRSDVLAKLNQANNDRAALWEKNSEAITEVREKRDEIRICLHDGYQEARDRRAQEYSQKALTDPAIREKFTRAAQEYNAAAARGDSAAIQKLQQMMVETVFASHDDSVEVQQKCGPVPPPLPAEGKLEALDKQIAALQEEIRKIDEKVADAQAQQGGLDRQQFAMALERIQMYLTWRRSHTTVKSKPAGFTPAEIEAMEKHLEELRAALG